MGIFVSCQGFLLLFWKLFKSLLLLGCFFLSGIFVLIWSLLLLLLFCV